MRGETSASDGQILTSKGRRAGPKLTVIDKALGMCQTLKETFTSMFYFIFLTVHEAGTMIFTYEETKLQIYRPKGTQPDILGPDQAMGIQDPGLLLKSSMTVLEAVAPAPETVLVK